MKAKKNKKCEKLWSKTGDIIKSITKSSDDYNEKYMKNKFNADAELALNKTVEIPSMTIVSRAIFLENNKYYPQVISDVCINYSY